MQNLFTRRPAHALRAGVFSLLVAISGLSAALPAQAAGASPPLMLANVYHPGVALQDYWVSEKYDGVRGYWDGEKLLTRGGERIAAPDSILFV